MAQMVKSLSAMQEMLVRSLGGEDPLKKGMATHSSNVQNLPLWHNDCFELKAVEKKQIQEKSSSSLYFPESKT